MEEVYIGMDEAGCGALMGPLFACAAIIPQELSLQNEVCDSKQIKGKKRLDLFHKICESALYGIGKVEHTEIDKNGLSWARKEVFTRALNALVEKHSVPNTIPIIVDGVHFAPDTQMKTTCIPKADTTHANVSAASIIAKVTRDLEIKKLCETHADIANLYGWETNMGYPSKKHREGVQEHGITKFHRTSYNPCKGKPMLPENFSL